MNLKNITLSIALIYLSGLCVAQSEILPGMKYLSPNTICPIFQNKEVKGYSVFYKTDKASKGNDNFHLAVYDQDLTKTSTINLQKPKNDFLLIGNGYNGSVLGFYFYNYKDDQFEIEGYDNSLKKVGSIKIPHKLTNFEKRSLQTRLDADAQGQKSFGLDMNLYPIEGKGFITNGILKSGKGYTLEMYDNKFKSQWKFVTDDDNKGYEYLLIAEANEKYLLGTVMKKPSMLSSKLSYFMVAFDVNTGKRIMEIPIETDEKEKMSLNAIVYDETKDQILVVGDYYDLKGNPGTSKSKGFFIKVFNPKGDELSKKLFSWDTDVKGKLPAEAKESIEKGSMNYTQKILKSKDGKIYLVCEQFSKGTDGLGIASNILGGGYGASMTKSVIRNMIIYVLNEDFTLNDIKFFPKDKSSCSLPAGADFFGSGLIGMYTKWYGEFDYQFTQMTNDGKSFDIVYVNYDREKGESTKRILGNILISPDGSFSVDKIDITTKANDSHLFPAKPGYLMMANHLKKSKSMEMKLVKLNF